MRQIWAAACLGLLALPQAALAQDVAVEEADDVGAPRDSNEAPQSSDPFVQDATEAIPGVDWASADDRYVDEEPDRRVKTVIYLSPDIVDRRDELIAFIESQPGWVVGEEAEAEFQVVPNPEFYQHLLFARIKRFSFDRSNSVEPSPAMDIAEVIAGNLPTPGIRWSDGRSGEQMNQPGKVSRPEWASPIPYPTNLGPADGPELLDRLAAAMAPIARHHGLLALANYNGRTFNVCVSNEQSSPGDCAEASPWNPPTLYYHKPIYIRAMVDAELEGVDAISVIAVAPDRAIIPLFTRYPTVALSMDPDGNVGERAMWVDNYDAPSTLKEFGRYQVIAIGSPDPLDPRIWSIRPGDDLPADICATEAQMLVCEALRGTFDASGSKAVSTGIAEFDIDTDLKTAVAPVGGRRALRSEGVWQAQLFLPREGSPFGTTGRARPGEVLRQNFEKAHKCGGSYLGDGLILTAAHCVAKRSLGEMQVRLGTLDIANGGSNFPIVSMVIHSGYGRSSGNADIALIRFKPDSRLTRLVNKGFVKPIDLAPAGQRLGTNTPVLVTGWGYTGATEAGTNPLLDIHDRTQRNARFLTKITLGTLPTSQCTRYNEFSMFASRDIICARSPVPGRDACYTDSGGPMTRKVAGKRELVGIVSAGIGCAEPGVPSVYTNVAAFRDWIERAKVKARQPGKHRLP